MASTTSTIKYILEIDSAPANSGILRTTEKAAALKDQLNRLASEYGRLSENSARKVLAELGKLQASAQQHLRTLDTKFSRQGQMSYLSASGASESTKQAQLIRNKIADVEAAYSKLQARFKEKIQLTINPAEIEKQKKDFERVNEILSRRNRLLQEQLGHIERLDQAHKPLLAKIFDFVVGYKLINTAVNAFSNLLQSIPQAGLQFETTYATMKAVFSVTSTVNSELEFLNKLSKDVGLNITTLRDSFSEFAASAKFSGESVGNINEIFSNLSKAGSVLHLPADKMKSAFTAINQMYAKNQVMMEELKKQLGNQLPAAVNIFALSMGKTTRQLMDDMKKGLVMPKETILEFSRTYASIFADPAALKYASEGVNAQIQRMQTAWTNFSTAIYESTKGEIKGSLSLLASILEGLTKHLGELGKFAIVASVAVGSSLVKHLASSATAALAARGGILAMSTAVWAAIPGWGKLLTILTAVYEITKNIQVAEVNVGKEKDIVSVGDVISQRLDDIMQGNIYNQGLSAAKRTAILKKQQELVARQASSEREKITESMKETLLASTQGAVDETMSGTTKIVQAALQRIETDFSKVKNSIENSTNRAVASLQVEIAKIQGKESLGIIDKVAAHQKIFEIQKQIFALQQQSKQEEIELLQAKQVEQAKVEAQQIASSAEAKREEQATHKFAEARRFIEVMQRVKFPGTNGKDVSYQIPLNRTSQETWRENPFFQKAFEKYNKENPFSAFKGTLASLTLTATEIENLKLQTIKAREALQKVTNASDKYNATVAEEGVAFKPSDITSKVNASLYASTQRAIDAGVGYKYGSKNSATGEIDCSGWVAEITNNVYKSMGDNATVKQAMQGVKAGAAMEGAAGIIKQIALRTGKELSGNQITKESLKEGMLIGLDASKGKSYSADNRYKGIDHIVQVVRNISTGLLEISEASSGKGVHLTNIDTWLNRTKKIAKYAVNPFETKYTPTSAEVKAGTLKPELEQAKTSEERNKVIAQKELELLQFQATLETEAAKSIQIQDDYTNSILQEQINFVKTQKDNALKQLETSKYPLSEQEKLAKTVSINEQYKARIQQALGEQIASIESQLSRGLGDAAKIAALKTSLLTLKQEQSTLSAEIDKDKVTIAINKVIPLQSALEKRQFELIKNLQASLGIFDEQTVKLDMQISQEETLKLIELERLKGNGKVADEMQSQIDKLNQIGLIQARLEAETAKASAIQGYNTAKQANEGFGQIKQWGSSGKWTDAWDTQEAAKASSGVLTGKLQSQEALLASQEAYTTKWYETKTAIEQTKMEMVNLQAAADQVLGSFAVDSINMIGEAFLSWTNGAKTAKQAFLDLGIEFAKMLQDMLMQALKAFIVKQILGLITGGLGGVASMGEGVDTSLAPGGAMDIIGGLGHARGGLIPAYARGGNILAFPQGGVVRGKGTNTSDSNLARVPIGSFVLNAKAAAKARRNKLIAISNDEVVINPEQVAQLGVGQLKAWNSEQYANGGLVGSAPSRNFKAGNVSSSPVYNVNIAVPPGTENPKQFGKDVSTEFIRSVAQMEASKQVNLYAKRQSARRS